MVEVFSSDQNVTMDSSSSSSSCSSVPLVAGRKNHHCPDSLKIDLLTIPENNCVEKFNKSVTKDISNVTFKNLSFCVKEGLFRSKRKKILDGINGEFHKGELTAIMGPSGSGKSTLMNILAGYTTTNVSGQILINNNSRNLTSFRRSSCYIMQDDMVQPLLTVYEAMMVAANLKLSSLISYKEKQTKIKDILESIGLWNQKKIRSCQLSGGQKKRLSIALELLKNPEVMFFDEPTSGLDSLSSKQCVKLLKDLAMMGRTIICTIHQPSAIIFDLFDHLYILANGKCMYQGSVKGVLPYLEQIHLKCPPYHNPADFLLEVVNGEHGSHNAILTQMSENGLNENWRSNATDSIDYHAIDHVDKMMNSGKITPVKAPRIAFPKLNDCDISSELKNVSDESYPISTLYQIMVLIKRSFLIIYRDKTLTFNRLFTHTGIAVFIGILYFGIGQDASTMLNNFNFMFFSIMFLMLTAFNCVTTTFPSELPILTREHFNKWYSLKSYYLAITIADIPIQIIATLIYATTTYLLTMQPTELFRILSFHLICVLISMVSQSFGFFIRACMDVKNGVIFGPFCFLPFTIFSGFFVQFNDCHPYLRWIFHISFLKYGLEGLVLSILGYDRPRLPCNAEYCHFVNPEKFLSTMDMENASYILAVIFLVSLVIVIRISTYLALKIRIKKFRSKK